MDRKSRLRIATSIMGGFLAILPTAAKAQSPQPPDTLPGLSPFGVYESGGIDHVSPYNGDPHVVVPLGPSYPLAPGYTWQLSAGYSSMFWHLSNPESSCGAKPRARILGYPTLGAGWKLELGFVYAPQNNAPNNSVLYVSPDGGRHKVNLPDGTVSSVTHDGSRLRISRFPTFGPITSYTVEFPDGTKGTFAHGYYLPVEDSGTSPDFVDQEDAETNAPALRMGLSNVTNPFPTPANATILYTVNYVSNVQTSPDAWKVSTIQLTPVSNPRTITYHWSNVTITDAGNANPTWDVLGSITFPTFGGSTFDVTFGYVAGNDPNIYPWPRNGYDNEPTTGPCATPTTVAVPLLAGISSLTDPAGATSGYSFTYTKLSPDDPLLARALKQITLPTSGTVKYDYATFTPCYHDCVDPETNGPVPDDPDATEALCRGAHGKVPLVATRTQHDPATNTDSVTSYDRYQYGPLHIVPTDCDFDDAHVARRVIVTTPSGNGAGTVKTRYLFHVDYGDSDGIEIERRLYDENANPNTATPIRSIVNCWNGDNVPAEANAVCGLKQVASDPPQDYPIGANVRQQASVIWYGANPYPGGTCPTAGAPVCTKSSNSTWDVFARRWETTKVTSTVAPWTSSNSRTTTTDWTPQTSAGFWSLDLFASRTKTDAGSGVPLTTTSTTYSFSSTNGFLGSLSTADATYGTITHTFTDDGGGNPGTEQISASGSGMTTGSFTDTRTFQNGVAKTTQRSGIGWKSMDVDLDPNTRVVQTSRDPNAALATTYVYDKLSRVTSTAKPGEGLETACYLNPINGYPPFSIHRKGGTVAQACQKDDGAGPWSTTVSAYQYDGLGRVIREIRRYPTLFQPANTYFARREKRYDSAGHLAYVSEWTPCPKDASYASTSISNCAIPIPRSGNPGTGTAWSNFDPIGRARHIARADGSSTDVSFVDGSVTFSDSKEQVSVHGVAGGDAVTTRTKDPLGRVVSVQEPNVPGETNVVTTYKYNVLDQLAEISEPGAGTTAGTTQTRTFTYDKLGLLRSEKIPEKWNGSAPVTNTYDKYDALGDPKQRTNGASPSQVVSTYTYDNAGRITQIEAPAGTKYMVTCYDGATTCDGISGIPTGGTYKNAHRTRSVGYNYIPTLGPQVIEDYTYSDPAGSPRLSALTTTSGNGDLTWAATQSWAYNPLGLIATRSHPRSTGAFSETITYSSGLPTKINANNTDVAKNVTYNPAGGIASWQAGNNVTTTITQDTSLLPRPRQISTSGVASGLNFDTGIYAYDGAANVTQEGADSFAYDARSRLTSATLQGFSARTFTSDRFGNITNLGGQAGQAPITVDARNNHVTSGSPSYDTRGNMTGYNAAFLTFDNIDRFTRNSAGGVDFNYVFDADGERAIKFQGYGNLVKRREIARQVAEANIKSGKSGWTGPPACTGVFTDVACPGDADAAYIELLYNKGVIAGCQSSPLKFCPESPVTRGQMAVFLVKGYEPEPVPTPACTGLFPVDLPCTNGFAPWAEELYRDGIAAGCGTGAFCPTTNVGEWEIMVWLSKTPGNDGAGAAWGTKYRPVPRGTSYTLRDEGNRILTEAIGGGTSTTPGDYATIFPSRDNVFLANLLVASYVSPVPNIVTSGTGWFYYHSDHLATPRCVTDASANRIEQRKYWPYGEEVSTTSPTTQDLRFSLMERDGEANHYYDHARTHDFGIGRFLSPDNLNGRIDNPQSFDRYSYALSNPLRYVDPDGHQLSAAYWGLAYGDPTAVQGAEQLPGFIVDAVVDTTLTIGSATAAVTLGAPAIVDWLVNASLGAASSPDDPLSGVAIGGTIGVTVGQVLPGSANVFTRGVASSVATQEVTTGQVDLARTETAAIASLAAQFEVVAAAQVEATPLVETIIEDFNAIIDFFAESNDPNCEGKCKEEPK